MEFYIDYVIDIHDAKRAGRHLDLRIKIPRKQKLMSFAIPKGRFPDEGEKFLAVRTPDHSMIWMNFSGDIPKDQYGAGKITIGQKGKAKITGWGPKQIKFEIRGKLASGTFSLIKFNSKEKINSWILMRVKNKEETK